MKKSSCPRNEEGVSQGLITQTSSRTDFLTLSVGGGRKEVHFWKPSRQENLVGNLQGLRSAEHCFHSEANVQGVPGPGPMTGQRESSIVKSLNLISNFYKLSF